VLHWRVVRPMQVGVDSRQVVHEAQVMVRRDCRVGEGWGRSDGRLPSIAAGDETQ
jgi:hypothetical protein